MATARRTSTGSVARSRGSSGPARVRPRTDGHGRRLDEDLVDGLARDLGRVPGVRLGGEHDQQQDRDRQGIAAAGAWQRLDRTGWTRPPGAATGGTDPGRHEEAPDDLGGDEGGRQAGHRTSSGRSTGRWPGRPARATGTAAPVGGVRRTGGRRPGRWRRARPGRSASGGEGSGLAWTRWRPDREAARRGGASGVVAASVSGFTVGRVAEVGSEGPRASLRQGARRNGWPRCGIIPVAPTGEWPSGKAPRSGRGDPRFES